MSGPRRKALVVLCQVFHPDPISTSQLFTGLFAELVRRGWDVSVCCAYPSDDRVRVSARVERHLGVEIRRVGWRIALKRSLLHRAASYASYLAGAFFRLLRSPRGSLHFGVTNPPFSAIILALVKRLTGRPFSYMFLDIHPEGLVALGELKGRSPWVRLWVRLNRWAYHQADALVVLGRDMAPLLSCVYGLPESRMEYIPHWSAMEVAKPKGFPESALAEQLGLRGRFVVQYSGNMGVWHDMETFVRAAARLKGREDIRFLFIGDGMRRKGAEALARELDATNIVWHPFVPLTQLDDSLAACHVALISLRAGLEGVAVPCKMYGILASGRAILAQVPRESEVAYTVRDHDCGVWVEPGDVEGLIRTIESLAADRAAVEAMGTRSFRAYCEHYTVNKATAAFDAHFERLQARAAQA